MRAGLTKYQRKSKKKKKNKKRKEETEASHRVGPPWPISVSVMLFVTNMYTTDVNCYNCRADSLLP